MPPPNRFLFVFKLSGVFFLELSEVVFICGTFIIGNNSYSTPIINGFKKLLFCGFSVSHFTPFVVYMVYRVCTIINCLSIGKIDCHQAFSIFRISEVKNFLAVSKSGGSA